MYIEKTLYIQGFPNMYTYMHVYIYIYIYIYIHRFFPIGRNGGESPPATSQRFAHPTHLEKFPHKRSVPLPPPLLHKIFICPTTKQQFSSYNPIKTACSAVVIALASFLF